MQTYVIVFYKNGKFLTCKTTSVIRNKNLEKSMSHKTFSWVSNSPFWIRCFNRRNFNPLWKGIVIKINIFARNEPTKPTVVLTHGLFVLSQRYAGVPGSISFIKHCSQELTKSSTNLSTFDQQKQDLAKFFILVIPGGLACKCFRTLSVSIGGIV